MGGAAGVSIGSGVASSIIGGISEAHRFKALADAAKAEGRLKQAEAYQSARQARKAAAREIAAQRVAFAVAGVSASSGTALDVLAENAGEYELEAVTMERFGRNAMALGKAAAANYNSQRKLAVAGSFLMANGAVAQGVVDMQDRAAAERASSRGVETRNVGGGDR